MVIFIISTVFILLEKRNELEFQKKLREKKVFCNVIMLTEDNKMSEFDQNKKFDKLQFNIYADLECIIEKIDGCKLNPENSSSTKVSKHLPSAFSIFTISCFKSTENKHDVYRGKDSMKKICEFLRERAMKIINFF